MVRERLLIFCLALPLFGGLPFLALAQEAVEHASFRVKYIAQGVVYLDAGRSAGLKEGQKLVIAREVAPPIIDAGKSMPPPPSGIIASLQVVSVAASSAVCEITSTSEPVQVGDLARYAAEEVKEIKEAHREEQEKEARLLAGREYPQVITFTSGDPVVEEARASVPKPPSPEINRMRGRIGMEYDTILSHTTPSSTSSAIGMVAQFNMTRIGGTYWDFVGYWRGRFTSLSGNAQPSTITDVINRTYQLGLTYNNPNSSWVAGGGRLYLPWAASLDVIDGGYIGRRAGEHTTYGIFAGSTPDPSSYDYNPNQRIGGAFVNFAGGDFNGVRYTTTWGVGVGTLGWDVNRKFFFSETGIFVKRNFSIYYAMEVDTPHTVVIPTSTNGSTPPTIENAGGLNRSYLTIRYVPHPVLELTLNDTYFSNVPTFDPTLIGTGLLDKYLFQGVSGGARINFPKKVSFYTTIGQSSRSGDTKSSWNQMYGVTLGELWKTGIRLDARYSRFNSSFGSGDYKAISLSKSLRDTLQWQLLGGIQDYNSTLTKTPQTHFITTYLDWSPGKVLFFQVGYTWQRGGTMNYDQFQFVVGKRFGTSWK